MLELKYNEEQKQVTALSLKRDGFFHFDSIAIPRVSDFIFRSRMFNTVWKSRCDALERIAQFVSDGKLFNASLLDMDLSNQRDYTILFGTKEQIVQMHTDEARFLPQNQSRKYHEKYALLTQLMRSQSTGEQASKEQITSLFNYLDTEVPHVSTSWFKVWLEDTESDWKSSIFYTPSGCAGEKFCHRVNEASKRTDILKNDFELYALGFIESDPKLLSPKSIEQEKKYVHQILQVISPPKHDLENDQP